MELILAIDLMRGQVVHGVRGERASYRPLTWGLVHSADPTVHVSEIAPRFLYIADLGRIMGKGSHDTQIESLARMVEVCYVDRGIRHPSEYLQLHGVTNIVGTETGGRDLSRYDGGYLSIDISDGAVIPSGADPNYVLREARAWAFEGCIILNVGAVGTESGLSIAQLGEMRSIYSGRLLYGGGVGSGSDLDTLRDLGFDGAILATALHRGAIPLSSVRRGLWS